MTNKNNNKNLGVKQMPERRRSKRNLEKPPKGKPKQIPITATVEEHKAYNLYCIERGTNMTQQFWRMLEFYKAHHDG